MPRPTTAVIDLSALRHNLSVARRQAPGARSWAVVKANAYGHGLLRAARAFAESDGLALVEPEGAVLLRQSGWKKPILLMEGCFDRADVSAVIEHGLQTVVHTPEQIGWLSAMRADKPVDVWLKLNTGMNRLGFRTEDAAGAIANLQRIPHVRMAGTMTHFANADDPANLRLSVAEQERRYGMAMAGVPGEHSLANSAADLLHPGVAADWIRPGIMLYGASPGTMPAAAFGLRPAMTLKSEVIALQRIAPGDAVGYGSTFVAERPMTIAVVACGYADGYPRHAPTGTPVLLHGIRTGLLGRVSMDMLTIDATGVPQAGVGSPVTLWGDGLPIDEVAACAGTIGYELMCAVAPRVHIQERNEEYEPGAHGG